MPEPGEGGERPEQLDGQEDHQEKRPEGERSPSDLADPQDEGHGGSQYLHGPAEPGLAQGEPELAEGRVQQPRGLRLQLPSVVPGRPEGLERGHSQHGVDEVGVHVLVGVPVLPSPLGEHPVPDPRDGDHRYAADQENARDERAVHPDHHGDGQGDGHRDHKLGEVFHEVGFDRLDAVGEDGVQRTTAARTGTHRPEFLELGQQRAPQVAFYDQTGTVLGDLPQELDQGTEHQDDSEGSGQPRELARAPLPQKFVEQRGVDPGRQDEQSGTCQAREHRETQQPDAHPGCPDD